MPFQTGQFTTHAPAAVWLKSRVTWTAWTSGRLRIVVPCIEALGRAAKVASARGSPGLGDVTCRGHDWHIDWRPVSSVRGHADFRAVVRTSEPLAHKPTIVTGDVLFCSFFQVVCLFLSFVPRCMRVRSPRALMPAVRGSLRRRSRLSHPAVRGSLRRGSRLSHPAVRGTSRRRSLLSHPAARGSSRHHSRINSPLQFTPPSTAHRPRRSREITPPSVGKANPPSAAASSSRGRPTRRPRSLGPPLAVASSSPPAPAVGWSSQPLWFRQPVVAVFDQTVTQGLFKYGFVCV